MNVVNVTPAPIVSRAVIVRCDTFGTSRVGLTVALLEEMESSCVWISSCKSIVSMLVFSFFFFFVDVCKLN